jgi:hypothetical protein
MSKTNVALVMVVLVAVLASAQFAEEEEKKSGDDKKKSDIEFVDDVDAKEPKSAPIRKDVPPRADAIPGYLSLSNGDRIEGDVYLTRDAKMKVFVTEKKENQTFGLDEVLYIEQTPATEQMEKEWRWKENASDEKVYTGKEYPWRLLTTTLHLKDGRTVTGDLTQLVYVRNKNGEQRFILHKRQKGEPGQKLADLLYVKLLDLRPPEKKPEAEKEKKEEKEKK